MMRLTDNNRRGEELAKVAEIVSHLAILPAVITHDWCTRAAACSASVRQGVLATVSIGNVDDQGRLTHLEASGGVDSGSPSRSIDPRLLPVEGQTFELAPLLHGIKSADQRTQLLRDSELLPAWQRSRRGRIWTELGFRDQLVAVFSLPPRDACRFALLELGSRDSEGAFSASDVSIVQATVPYLRKRVVLAFGAQITNPLNVLTEKEQEVLEHLVLGKTVKQIAEDLERSAHTIHDHVKSLHRKLNISSRGELVARTLGHLGRPTSPSNHANTAPGSSPNGATPAHSAMLTNA